MIANRFSSSRWALAVALLALGSVPLAVRAQDAGAVVDNPSDALSRYLRTLAGDPRDLPALLGAGRAALDIGDPNAAVGFYARAEQANPRSAAAKAGLGSTLVQLEQPDRALALFAEAQRLGASEASFAADRGLAYDLKGDNLRAQHDYALALKSRRDDETLRRYALSLGITGDRDKALTLLDPLIRKRDPAAWRARAFVLALNRDVAGADGIAQAMMPSQAAAMHPFLVQLASLSAQDKAAAVNFGDMPGSSRAASSPDYAGAGTALAYRGAASSYATPPARDGGGYVQPDAALVPRGAPLGSAVAREAVPAATAAPSRYAAAGSTAALNAASLAGQTPLATPSAVSMSRVSPSHARGSRSAAAALNRASLASAQSGAAPRAQPSYPPAATGPATPQPEVAISPVATSSAMAVARAAIPSPSAVAAVPAPPPTAVAVAPLPAMQPASVAVAAVPTPSALALAPSSPAASATSPAASALAAPAPAPAAAQPAMAVAGGATGVVPLPVTPQPAAIPPAAIELPPSQVASAVPSMGARPGFSAGLIEPAPGTVGPPAPVREARAEQALAEPTRAAPETLGRARVVARLPVAGGEAERAHRVQIASAEPSAARARGAGASLEAGSRQHAGREAEGTPRTGARGLSSDESTSEPKAEGRPALHTAGTAKRAVRDEADDISDARTKPASAGKGTKFRTAGIAADETDGGKPRGTDKKGGHSAQAGASDRGAKADDGDRPARGKGGKTDRDESLVSGRKGDRDATAKASKTDHDDGAAKGDKAERAGKSDKTDKADKDSKAEKSAKADKTHKPADDDASDAPAKGGAARSRIYVQVAGGANRDDLDKAWTRVKTKAPELMKGRAAHTTPLRFTNRLIVGPFKDEDEAQGFVNKMAGKGLSGFLFKSEKGQKIEKIDGGK